MKKINSILMILAAAAGLTNCSKADLVENKEAENGGTVVYATTDAATKTTLSDDYNVLWSTGDQIKFVKDDATGLTYTFTLDTGSGSSSGTFKCTETPSDGTYTVYYPASYDGTNWPVQTYVSATDISRAPMMATATVSDGSISDLTFKNEGGILRYTVKGSKTIKSINVKSASPALDVTLSCLSSGAELKTEGTVFNIALPTGTYSDATLTFTATDESKATKTADSFTVKKNTVSLATFEESNLSFVPLEFEDLGVTSSGKKLLWAKCNLGAINPEDPGNYYMWGATQLIYTGTYTNTSNQTAFEFVDTNPYGSFNTTWNKTKGFDWVNAIFTDGLYNDSTKEGDAKTKVFTKYTTQDKYAKGSKDNHAVLENTDDAAAATKSTWRMPKKEDFDELCANCVLIWNTTGYNGKSGYIVYKAKNNDDKGKAKINGTWKIWDGDSKSYKTDGASEAKGYDIASDSHIFLPVTGCGSSSNITIPTAGLYWSSSLDVGNNSKAYSFVVGNTGVSTNAYERYKGLTIRPVSIANAE